MDVRSGGACALRTMLRVRNSVGTWLFVLLAAYVFIAFPTRVGAQSAICAEVKIQIDQKVSLERQAFDAALRIRNGLEGVQVERVDVKLVFKDMNGAEASVSGVKRRQRTYKDWIFGIAYKSGAFCDQKCVLCINSINHASATACE